MRKAKFKAPIYFEGNGIDCASIEKLSDRESARKELKLKKDDIAFAMIARWEPVKGQLHFIRAFEKLCVDHENCVAVLVGENMGLGGKYARRVQAAIDQSPYKDRIRVLGMRDDAVRILSGCDILSLPSKKEGIPRVVMEAMALNLPVIATNVPGTRELVVHGKTGLLSAYGDVVGLAINMEILLELPDARKKLGDAGKALIHSQYRESQVIARILAAYDQVKSESFDSIAQDTRC